MIGQLKQTAGGNLIRMFDGLFVWGIADVFIAFQKTLFVARSKQFL